MVKWLCGEINETEVLDRAGVIETYYHLRKHKASYTRDQIESRLEEILYKLDGIHYQLIIKKDIPRMIEFLQAEPKDHSKAWRNWEKYWEGIDYDKRRTELGNNTFYITS